MTIQQIQTAHRRRLADAWQIAPGAHLLEIGCGQGDMTAVLAERVGPQGHVTAVDLAGPEYGAPQTLGQATAALKASPLGPRMTFHFEFDILRDRPERTHFDAVVLAMSSWYFGSCAQLSETLRKAREYAPWLYFAEWDLQPTTLDQLPHLLAVLIQARVAEGKTDSLANVRTPLTSAQLKALVAECGWRIESETKVDSPDLQDADWEIAAARRAVADNPGSTLLDMELALLDATAKPAQNRPLACYAFVATRE